MIWMILCVFTVSIKLQINTEIQSSTRNIQYDGCSSKNKIRIDLNRYQQVIVTHKR